MKKLYKYYEMKTLTEPALTLCHKITATKLQSLSYGVAVIVIISIGKDVKNS